MRGLSANAANEFAGVRRDSAAIRRARAAMSSIEFSLLEFHSLLRRSAVEAKFDASESGGGSSGGGAGAGAEDSGSVGGSDRGGGGTPGQQPSPTKMVSCAWVVSTRPTLQPTQDPTHVPTPLPTSQPTPRPTSLPSPHPTFLPIPAPTSVPVPAPTKVQNIIEFITAFSF